MAKQLEYSPEAREELTQKAREVSQDPDRHLKGAAKCVALTPDWRSNDPRCVEDRKPAQTNAAVSV